MSEDFHVDLNDFHLRSLIERQSAKSLNSNNSGSTQQIGASGLVPKDQWPTLAQQVRRTQLVTTYIHTYIQYVVYTTVQEALSKWGSGIRMEL